MIEEDFVSPLTAMLLKDKGFDVSIPTLHVALKWLRITHGIYVQACSPIYEGDGKVTYNVIISNLRDCCLAFDTPLEDVEYNSPEEACEAGLQYSLIELLCMTREEEIKRTAKENTSNQLEFDGFIEGARWADKSMIKRVCEFIQNHHHEYSSWNTEECEEFDTQKFIEDIRKIIQ